MKQNITHAKSVLSLWVWTRPLQFMFYTLISSFGIGLIYMLIARLLFAAPAFDLSPVPMMILLGINFIGWIIWLIRKLPHETLDQHSFIGLATAQEIISMFVMVIVTVLTSLAWGARFGGLAVIWVLFSTLAMYVIGLSVSSVYGTFLRARKMNVPTWKFICSLPIGYILFWFAGYITPDARATKNPVIKPEPNRFARVVKWIASHPKNSMIAAAIITLVSFLINGGSGVFSLVAFAIFGIWYAVYDATKTRRATSGILAYIAILLNIIAIIISVNSALNAPDVTTQITNIEVIETVPAVQQ